MSALASLADVEARLRRPLTTDEKSWIDDSIEEASALVSGYLGCEYMGVAGTDGVLSDVPTDVRVVTSRVVARAMAQADAPAVPIGVSQIGRTMGPFSEQFTVREGAGSGSPWLENVDRMTLRRHRCGGGMRSVSLGSDRTGRFR